MIGLSPSSFYYKPKIEPQEREKRDADLRDIIEALHLELPGYGYRRIKWHLFRVNGVKVNEKRIRRIMHKYGLFPVIWKKFVRTTNSKHGHEVYPHLLKDKKMTGINQAWVTDITYIRILTCFVYLAVVIDLYSRKVIGWGISKTLHHDLCLEALKMAIEKRSPPQGCIHHSDRGVQYACKPYVDLLKEHHFQISMSRKGNCYDNAFAETFFKTLKYEEVHLSNYETYEDVIKNVPFFMEEVYNKKRLHSSLGYFSPQEFEENIQDKDEE